MNITEFKARVTADITAMRACTNNDFIFAWPYGLGVKVTSVPGGEIRVEITSVPNATSIPANSQLAYRKISNGANQQAHLMRRQVALKRQIAALETMLAMPELNAIGI